MLSVFDGPRGDINNSAEDVGMKPMPPIDTKSNEPFDLLNDVHFASIMVAILMFMPLFVMFAPECTSWSRANDFNNNKPKARDELEKEKTNQRRVMDRMRAMLRAVWSYGGDAMIENPEKK